MQHSPVKKNYSPRNVGRLRLPPLIYYLPNESWIVREKSKSEGLPELTVQQ